MKDTNKINEVLQIELAKALNKLALLEGVLITVSYVNCSPDLKTARVGISVLPDKLAGSALKKMKSITHILVSEIKNRVKMRKLPKLIWEFDATEREAEKIEKIINEANS